MPLPLKMKTTMSVLVVATMTLFMTASFFIEVSATCRQRQIIVNKSINLLASSEAEAAVGYLPLWQALPKGQHDPRVPTLSQETSNAHYSVEAARIVPQCNQNVPTPGCLLSRETPQMNNKAELIRNDHTSVHAEKRAVSNRLTFRFEAATAAPQCNPHVPTPGCLLSSEEKQMNSKAELIRNDHTSVHAEKRGVSNTLTFRPDARSMVR